MSKCWFSQGASGIGDNYTSVYTIQNDSDNANMVDQMSYIVIDPSGGSIKDAGVIHPGNYVRFETSLIVTDPPMSVGKAFTIQPFQAIVSSSSPGVPLIPNTTWKSFPITVYPRVITYKSDGSINNISGSFCATGSQGILVWGSLPTWAFNKVDYASGINYTVKRG